MSFFWKARLSEAPSELLQDYYANNLRLPDFLAALHLYEKAHLIALDRNPLVPRDALAAMADGFRAMEAEGVLEARGKLWNVVHGGEEYLRGVCGEAASGWIHLGRSSPNIRVAACRIAIRRRILDTLHRIVRLRDAIVTLAAKHARTPMPGYSYLQQLDETTFGFYLMSWVPGLERDFNRTLAAFENANLSPVAAEGGYGTQFEIDISLIDRLLAFDRAPMNARDVVRNYDYILESLSALALLHHNLGRLAIDLVIWNTGEFSLVSVADRFCISSSYAPQFRAPYVLGHVSGMSGVAAGALMGALAAGKTASDQVEPATLLPVEYFRCQEDSARALEAMTGLIETLTVNEARMHELAEGHWSQASALLGLLVTEKGVPYRVAHQVVAKVTRVFGSAGIAPPQAQKSTVEDALREYAGSEVALSEEEWRRLLDPMWSVQRRRFYSGTAPERVDDHVEQARAQIAADGEKIDDIERRLADAEESMTAAFARLPTAGDSTLTTA